MIEKQFQTRQDRGWGQRLRWVHVKSGKTNHLIFPETHKIELKNLAMGAKCNFVGLEEDAYNKMEGIVQRFGTENHEKLADFEPSLSSLNRTTLVKLVVSLGGNADETQMMSDAYREQIRNRARELISWIIQSGNAEKLGITKTDVINGKISEKRKLNSAMTRADIWAKRYHQQNFESWNSPAGKPYQGIGEIEMKTPNLLRTSLCIEDDSSAEVTEIDYGQPKRLAGSARARQRQVTTTHLLDREFKNSRDDIRLLTSKSNYIRATMVKPVAKGASFLEQSKSEAPVDEQKEKITKKWKKGFNTANILSFSKMRPTRPFTTSKSIGAIRFPTKKDMKEIKIQLQYLYWMLESLSEPFVPKPPSILIQAETDPYYPNEMQAVGTWNSFLSMRRQIGTLKPTVQHFRNRRTQISVMLDIGKTKEKATDLPTIKEQMRAFDLTRVGRMRAKQNALNKLDNTGGSSHKVFREMRNTSVQFLKPEDNTNETDVRDGWLGKLKRKFSKSQMILLEDEFDNLECITLPKMSYLAQEEFYRALKSLRIYQLQDPNFKAVIEFTRDLLCIDEVTFDRWFDNAVNSETTKTE